MAGPRSPFRSGRAAGAHLRPFAPLVTLAGEALFVLPWLWLPMMVVFTVALRRGPTEWRSWLLCCLAAPPIVVFAAVSAWSNQRVLFHWAAPGYLMLFPLLGEAVARRLDQPAIRRMLLGTAVFVVLGLAVVATQVRFDWLRPVIAAVDAHGPRHRRGGLDLAARRPAARNLLRPGTIVGVPNWRDAGKIAYALGPGVTTLCLNRDARQFGIAWPPARFIDADVLILAPEHRERVAAEWSLVFDSIERLPDTSIRHAGRTLRTVAVFRHGGCEAGLLPSDDIIPGTMISDRVLSPTELRALSGRSNAQGPGALAIHLALLAAPAGWSRSPAWRRCCRPCWRSDWCRSRCSRRRTRRRTRPRSPRVVRT